MSPRAEWQPTVGQHLLLSGYWFSLNVQGGSLLTIVVPVVLDRLAGAAHTLALARLATLSAILAMAAAPLAGAASDRARARGRSRRGMIAAGAACNAAGLLWMRAAPGTGGLLAGLCLATVGSSASQAAYQALLPDVVPAAQRGAAAGYMGAASLLGTIAGMGLAGLAGPGPAYAFMLVTLAAGAASALAVADGRAPEMPGGGPGGGEGRRAWGAGTRRSGGGPGEAPGSRHDYVVTFAGRFLSMLGLSLLMTFVLYFLQDVLHLAEPGEGTAAVGGLALVGATVSTLWAGGLSDRLPRPRVAAVAGLPMAATALAFALLPSPRAIFAFAAVFGLGYGAYLSVDWALGVDALPAPASAARDLGVWGIASTLPSVLAPAVGGAVLASAATPAAGYRLLFALAGACFLAGSAVVLRVGARPLSPAWTAPLRLAVAAGLWVWVHANYRVRLWGRLPRRRGATLIVANHQHDLDGLVVLPAVTLGGPWRDPVFCVASRRMFERGFLAWRGAPLPRALTRRVDLSPVLHLLGVLPLENEPRTRPLAGLAREVAEADGDPPAQAAFAPELLGRLEARAGRPLPPGARTSVLWRRPPFDGAAWDVTASLGDLRGPHRRRALERARVGLEAQLRRVEGLLRAGGTVYVTPEGHATRDGRLRRPREALGRLLAACAAAGGSVWLAALAYDPLRAGRMGVLGRLVPLAAGESVFLRLAAARPVTASQVVAAAVLALGAGGRPFAPAEVEDAVAARIRSLPAEAFCDPELCRRPARVVRRALAHLRRRGFLAPAVVPAAHDGPGERVRQHPRRALRLAARRADPRFARVGVDDVLAHQAAMLEETLAALAAAGAVGDGSSGTGAERAACAPGGFPRAAGRGRPCPAGAAGDGGRRGAPRPAGRGESVPR